MFNLQPQECTAIIDGLASLTPSGELKVVPAFPRIDKFMDFYRHKLQDGQKHNYLPFFIKPTPALFACLMNNVHQYALVQQHVPMQQGPINLTLEPGPDFSSTSDKLSWLQERDIPTTCSSERRKQYLTALQQQTGLEVDFNPGDWIFSYFDTLNSPVHSQELNAHLKELIQSHTQYIEERDCLDVATNSLDLKLHAGIALNYFLGCLVDMDTATCELLEIDLINAQQQPWNVFFYYPFGNFQHCQEPTLFIDWLFELSKFKVFPAVMTENSLDFYVPDPESIPLPDIIKAAQAYLGLSPVLFDEGHLGSVGMLADILRKSNVWHMAWPTPDSAYAKVFTPAHR